VMSGDGRFVVFSSLATNLDAAPDTNGVADVFVHDRDADEDGMFDETGVGETSTVRLTNGNGASGGSSVSSQFLGMSISDDGRYVAFASEASNLIAGDTNGKPDVFVLDRDADGNGVFDESGGTAITRVSVASDGTEG